MAFLTMEVLGRHSRTRAITRDRLSPANRRVAIGGDASWDVARVVSDVSVLCPCVVGYFDYKAVRSEPETGKLKGRPR
jgi:hypothetical protein